MASGGRRKKGRAEPPVRVDANGATDAAIGAQAGLSPAEFESVADRLRESIARLETERDEGRRPFLELAARKEDLAKTIARAEELRGEIDWFVIVAGEGSALGNRVLGDALIDGVDRGGAGRVGMLFVDGADPGSMRAVLERVELRRSVFHVITRAGESVETLAAFLVLRDRLLSDLGAVEYTRHILLTTDADAGPLRQIVNDEGLHATNFPSGVAGHQAASSPAHLLGAQLLEIDVEGFLAGVQDMEERCRAPEPQQNPAALLAAAYYLLATLHGVQTSVLFGYSDRLSGLSEWWRQFWSTTLGKKLEGESSNVSVGTTPVVARGTVDQYTQLQMYLEGPADKVLTFVRVADAGPRVEIPDSYGDVEDIGYLGGRSLEDLVEAERQAVEWATARAGRPSVTIELPALTPHALGQAVRLFERAALLCASLHDVDPHARPAVEATRRLVYGALRKPGFEAEGEELKRWLDARQEKWIL
ncbi:MAG: hypothetical protein P8R42_03955 [Candidatus Binatia bacterium]|nr:hypothetical protein [Candidatus Binatia bacterium]